MLSDERAQTGPWDPVTAADRTGSATGAVIGHVEELIFGGSLQPGDPLPSEAELADRLGYSRLTVREGIRTLQARGLLEINHGRRATVARPNADQLRDFFSASIRRDVGALLELLDVRLAVEVQTATLAAAHATRSNLAAIEMALTLMESSINDEAAFNDADVRFHAALAVASGNRMLSFLVEGMEEPLQAGRLASISGYRSTHEDLEGLIAQHTAIYKAVAARDPSAAAAAMRRHLLQTRKDLNAAFTGNRPIAGVARGRTAGRPEIQRSEGT